MKSRLPLVLAALALAISILGAAGPAVAHGVQHALFAHDAGKVDGLDAASKPTAGKLLPLNSSAKVPARVLPDTAGVTSPRARATVRVTWDGVTRTVALDEARTRNFTAVEPNAVSGWIYWLTPAAGIDPATSAAIAAPSGARAPPEPTRCSPTSTTRGAAASRGSSRCRPRPRPAPAAASSHSRSSSSDGLTRRG